MLYSELLKHYPSLADKKGRLIIEKIPNLKLDGRTWNAFRCYINGERFFFKSCPKSQSDAEVLISQLFPKLGVPSACYLPVDMGKNKNGVISNCVRGQACQSAYNFRGIEILKTGSVKEASKHFTEEGIKQIAVMQALDCATCNNDRHDGNYFVHKDSQGKVKTISTIDHANSDQIMKNIFGFISFYDHFSMDVIESRERTLRTLKENNIVLSAVSPTELAKTIGDGIDLIPQTAKDIEEAIGYKVNEDYVSVLQHSFDHTAEELNQ